MQVSDFAYSYPVVGFYPFKEINFYSLKVVENGSWVLRSTVDDVKPHFEIEGFNESDFLDYDLPPLCTDLPSGTNLNNWIRQVTRIPMVNKVIFQQFRRAFTDFMFYFPINIILRINGDLYDLKLGKFVYMSVLDESYVFLDFSDITFEPEYRFFNCSLTGEQKNLTTYRIRLPFEKIFKYKQNVTLDGVNLLSLFPKDSSYSLPYSKTESNTFVAVLGGDGLGISYKSTIVTTIVTLHHDSETSEFTDNYKNISYSTDKNLIYRVISNGFVFIFRIVGHEPTYTTTKETYFSRESYPKSETNIYTQKIKEPLKRKYEVFYYPLVGSSSSDLDSIFSSINNYDPTLCCLAQCFGITE